MHDNDRLDWLSTLNAGKGNYYETEFTHRVRGKE
jgi:hypothetical protein